MTRDIDTANEQFVGMRLADRAVIVQRPITAMCPDCAIRHAAWLVAIAEPHASRPFADQAPPLADADHAVRPQMCDDCAYRPGSPERAGDEHAAGDAELLERIAADAKPFWCHQGMRRPLAFRHEPTGTEVPADNVGGAELAYRPPIVDGRPFRADGTPADLCAGWDARRRALAAHSAKEKTAPYATHPFAAVLGAVRT